MTTPTPLPLDAAKTLKVTACICVYCGASVAYGPSLTDDAIQAVRDSMMAHDAVCPKNPIAARVAELEAENEERRIAFDDALNELRAQIARANALRDALEKVLLSSSIVHARDIAEAALAAHPAASLAAHDAEVGLRVAKAAVEATHESIEMGGNGDPNLHDIVERALAAQEVKP